MKPVVGLTGGIASGKSTVSRWLREHGAGVVDADAIARGVVAPGTPGLSRIVQRFGDEVLSADGTLDRARLGAIVFTDANARRDLNAITHPLIAAEGARQTVSLLGDPSVDIVFYDAALLVESGQAGAFAALVVVACTAEQQRDRLRDRDHLSDEEIDRRLAAQLPLAEKVAAADYVIDNSGPREALVAEASRVLQALRDRFVVGGSEA